MKARRKSGALRVDLTATESQVLADVLDDCSDLIAGGDPDDPVLQRLFPDGYTDDEQASAELRQLIESDLRTERIDRLGVCRAELPPAGGRMLLDDEAADRWIRVLNDARLSLGTRLGVSEDVELDPRAEGANLYHWLTAVQDVLVGHLLD